MADNSGIILGITFIIAIILSLISFFRVYSVFKKEDESITKFQILKMFIVPLFYFLLILGFILAIIFLFIILPSISRPRMPGDGTFF